MIRDNSLQYINYFIFQRKSDRDQQENEKNNFDFTSFDNLNTDRVISQNLLIISNFILNKILKNDKRADLAFAAFEDLSLSLN